MQNSLSKIIDSLTIGEAFSIERFKHTSKLKKIVKPELMPANFDEFKGQTRTKTILQDTVRAAIKQNRQIDHILLAGLPGQGKTTLAWLVASEAKRAIVTITAGSIEKPIDIYNIFKEVEKEQFPIVFIDEIHALKKSLAELLYVPMESPGTVLHFPSTYGTLNFDITVKPFTLIGASAGEIGKIAKPMLDRIHLRLNLDPYSIENIISIVMQTSKKIELNLPDELANEIAQRSSLIPRKANNLIRVLKNFIVSRNITKVTHQVLMQVFDLLDIDELGIDKVGRKIIEVIVESQNGCIGLKPLASMVGIDEQTLTKIYEPELVSLGIIKYLSRGRAITEFGLKYFKKMKK